MNAHSKSKTLAGRQASVRSLSRILLVAWAVSALTWLSAVAGSYSKLFFAASPLLLAVWAWLQFKHGANQSWRIFGGIVLLSLIIASPFIALVVFR